MTLGGQVVSAGDVLPHPLASEYPGDVQLIGYGGEADVFRVHRARGETFALKLYRHGIRADRHVWARLENLRHGAVVRVEDHGTAGDGRDYEVLEHLEGGSLLVRLGEPMTEHQVYGLVRQLAGGLNCLHEADLVHRDLKPANLLYRGGGADSALVISDFGISRDPSVVERTKSATVAYAPPEALLRGTVSAAHDWWSLGMIVRQAATGAVPFAGRSESEIMGMLETQDVSLEQVPGKRLRQLCAGLLQRDPARRWAGQQVLEWLDGKDVEVRRAKQATIRISAAGTVMGDGGADRPAPMPAPAQGLEYGGELHTTRASLAAAIRKERNAAQRLFGDMGTRQVPSERWRGLLEWIRGIDGLGADEREERIELIDRWLTRDFSADVKLLRLLLWLDRDGMPVLRGDLLGPDRLAEKCAAAYRRGDGAEARLLRTLDRQVAAALSDFPVLRGMRRSWEKSVDDWRSARVKVKTSGGVPVAYDRKTTKEEKQILPNDRLNVLLLLCSLPGRKAAEELAALGREHLRPEEDSAWYGDLYQSFMSADTTGKLGMVARIHYGPRFTEWQEEQEREAAELARAERERREIREREAARRAQAKREWHEAQEKQEQRRSRLEEAEEELLRIKVAWDAAEKRRLAQTVRLRSALLACICYLVYVAAAIVTPCVLLWGTPDAAPGTGRALLYETGFLALPGTLSAMKRGWAGGGAYRPALFTVLRGKEAVSSWWDRDVMYGSIFSAAYVLLVGWQWDAFLREEGPLLQLLEVAFLLVTGVISLVLAVLFTAADKIPLDPGFVREKEEFERQVAELEAVGNRLRVEGRNSLLEDKNGALLAALRSSEGLGRVFPGM
ncbi:serine/threonine-protein kinase [Streptomyces caelestis]|uniref:serine/threonine-protein kinase n=1 Tax=Streptomyces caelestis TaxID=36816 RepID=UPI00364B3FB7